MLLVLPGVEDVVSVLVLSAATPGVLPVLAAWVSGVLSGIKWCVYVALILWGWWHSHLVFVGTL